MRGKRVMFHQLVGDLPCQRGIESPLHIDQGQLLPLGVSAFGQFLALALQIGLFRVRLRADRDILAGCHRHRAGDESRDSRDEDVARRAVRRGDADEETGGRHDPVIRAQHRSA